MSKHIKYISQRLSLRKPQIEALVSLSQFLDRGGLLSNESIDWDSITREFPGMKEFERDFPSVCFSLATGVGKTRLMGAMIAYLAIEKRIRNFLIFAPNNTILDKLVKDFSDPTHGKYVFRGIQEFATNRPKIITAENFSQGYGVRNESTKQMDFLSGNDDIHINIFSIAKMHADKRKIKQINDYMDVSYFDYLSELEDLVVLMDEAHQYRAHAGMRTIQGLNPLLGLELTATPQVERSGSSVRFKNILYDYPLSEALKDGFLKEPAVAGRENFDRKNFRSEEELEKLKIEDGIRLHERTKLHLRAYGEQKGEKIVKPLILIVAQDTKHADQIKEMIQDPSFFSGSYKEKVLVVHSEVRADAEEKMVRDLLEVESSDNPIEIVIHVNMLREGWDIANLYTMVPLRKANSKTLIEQNLGRGLRLPFGDLTGDRDIDTHTVVSHDRFNEIIDAANREDSIIRRGVVIGKDISTAPLEEVEVQSYERIEIGKIEDEEERNITLKAYEAIHHLGMATKNEVLDHVQRGVIVKDSANLESIVENFLTNQQRKGISIPRILIQPKVDEENKGRFLPFQLDLRQVFVKPLSKGIIVQGLRSGERFLHESQGVKNPEEDCVNQLLIHLLDFDEVAECDKNHEVLRDYATQMVNHLRSYLEDESQVVKVIGQQAALLANIIHTQMLKHFKEPVVEWDQEVALNMIPLRNMRLPSPKGAKIRHYAKPVEDKLLIREMIFEGFLKSLYPLVKFDSDSERIFSVILEQDDEVNKWLKPSRGVFNFIHYTKDSSYEPDFIVETADKMYLVEIKRRSNMQAEDVIAKGRAAAYWCQLATDHALKHSEKPWTYLLIPHDVLNLSMSLRGLVAAHEYRQPLGAING